MNEVRLNVTGMQYSYICACCVTFQSNCTAESAELFVNCLEAMVETCLPSEDGELEQYPSMLSVSSTVNLSSSLSSLTLGSPTEKGNVGSE